MQARGQIRQACCLSGPLEVVVVNHRVAIDIKHAAVVAGGGEVDGYRRGAGAGDHDIAIPAGLDVVIVAAAEIVIGGVAHAIGEPIVRDIREVDGPDELRGHGGGLIPQPGGIAGVGGLDQVLGRGKVEIGADEPLDLGESRGGRAADDTGDRGLTGTGIDEVARRAQIDIAGDVDGAGASQRDAPAPLADEIASDGGGAGARDRQSAIAGVGDGAADDFIIRRVAEVDGGVAASGIGSDGDGDRVGNDTGWCPCYRRCPGSWPTHGRPGWSPRRCRPR